MKPSRPSPGSGSPCDIPGRSRADVRLVSALQMGSASAVLWSTENTGNALESSQLTRGFKTQTICPGD